MIGIYLSGTGNTKHCLEKLLHLLDPSAPVLPIEKEGIVEEIRQHDTIYLAHPTQFSNIPYMVRDFIEQHAELWKEKKVFCMTTMGVFSGDGAGCAARCLRKHGATILGGLQVRMPDSVCDNAMLKKSLEVNRQIVRNANKKIESVAQNILAGAYPQEGLSVVSHLVGLFGQRLWFYGKTRGYSDKLKISDACIGCGVCAKLCPMNNIEIRDKRAVANSRCTMCYRCISHCPKQAITLLGKKVCEQCLYEKYADSE